jgi:hypothetical protein
MNSFEPNVLGSNFCASPVAPSAAIQKLVRVGRDSRGPTPSRQS